MDLICLSVSHHNTPVELRECLALTEEQIVETVSRQPIRAGLFESIFEMAVLSTCNRLEIYAVILPAKDAQPEMDTKSPEVDQTLLAYLGENFKIPTRRIRPYLRRYPGIQAVRHLYQVTAGLDSIAIGETQILGQVSRALDLALRIGAARHVLSSLFRSAIHAGKRVRTETEIGRHPTSLSALGVQLANEKLGGLAGLKVLVIGAGKMGTCTLEALLAQGALQVCLTNRTDQRAREMVERYGGAALAYARLFEGLAGSDIVFTATAAPQPVLHRALIAEVMARRPGRPLTLIDLAVPRNVETDVTDIPEVRVFDMDDLQSFAKDAASRSHPEIAQADAIVAEEVAAYEKLLHIIPFIGELHKKVEEIRQREVEKTLRQLRHADPQISEQIEQLSRSLVRKILHEPTMHLRSETDQETLNDYVDTLARLYDLDNNGREYSIVADTQQER